MLSQKDKRTLTVFATKMPRDLYGDFQDILRSGKNPLLDQGFREKAVSLDEALSQDFAVFDQEGVLRPELALPSAIEAEPAGEDLTPRERLERGEQDVPIDRSKGASPLLRLFAGFGEGKQQMPLLKSLLNPERVKKDPVTGIDRFRETVPMAAAELSQLGQGKKTPFRLASGEVVLADESGTLHPVDADGVTSVMEFFGDTADIISDVAEGVIETATMIGGSKAGLMKAILPAALGGAGANVARQSIAQSLSDEDTPIDPGNVGFAAASATGSELLVGGGSKLLRKALSPNRQIDIDFRARQPEVAAVERMAQQADMKLTELPIAAISDSPTAATLGRALKETSRGQRFAKQELLNFHDKLISPRILEVRDALHNRIMQESRRATKDYSEAIMGRPSAQLSRIGATEIAQKAQTQQLEASDRAINRIFENLFSTPVQTQFQDAMPLRAVDANLINTAGAIDGHLSLFSQFEDLGFTSIGVLRKLKEGLETGLTLEDLKQQRSALREIIDGSSGSNDLRSAGPLRGLMNVYRAMGQDMLDTAERHGGQRLRAQLADANRNMRTHMELFNSLISNRLAHSETPSAVLEQIFRSPENIERAKQLSGEQWPVLKQRMLEELLDKSAVQQTSRQAQVGNAIDLTFEDITKDPIGNLSRLGVSKRVIDPAKLETSLLNLERKGIMDAWLNPEEMVRTRGVLHDAYQREMREILLQEGLGEGAMKSSGFDTGRGRFDPTRFLATMQNLAKTAGIERKPGQSLSAGDFGVLSVEEARLFDELRDLSMFLNRPGVLQSTEGIEPRLSFFSWVQEPAAAIAARLVTDTGQTTSQNIMRDVGLQSLLRQILGSGAMSPNIGPAEGAIAGVLSQIIKASQETTSAPPDRTGQQ